MELSQQARESSTCELWAKYFVLLYRSLLHSWGFDGKHFITSRSDFVWRWTRTIESSNPATRNPKCPSNSPAANTKFQTYLLIPFHMCNILRILQITFPVLQTNSDPVWVTLQQSCQKEINAWNIWEDNTLDAVFLTTEALLDDNSSVNLKFVYFSGAVLLFELIIYGDYATEDCVIRAGCSYIRIAHCKHQTWLWSFIQSVSSPQSFTVPYYGRNVGEKKMLQRQCLFCLKLMVWTLQSTPWKVSFFGDHFSQIITGHPVSTPCVWACE